MVKQRSLLFALAGVFVLVATVAATNGVQQSPPGLSATVGENLRAQVGSSADLSVTKTGPAEVNRGALLTYTIVVSNGGPSAVSNIVVEDPAGSAVQGTFEPTASSPECSYQVGASPPIVRCSGFGLGVSAPPKTLTVAYRISTTASCDSSVWEHATVYAANHTPPDPDASDDWGWPAWRTYIRCLKQCVDGFDNDADMLIDANDPGCDPGNSQDNDERNVCPAATPASTCQCGSNGHCTSPDTCRRNGGTGPFYCLPPASSSASSLISGSSVSSSSRSSSSTHFDYYCNGTIQSTPCSSSSSSSLAPSSSSRSSSAMSSSRQSSSAAVVAWTQVGPPHNAWKNCNNECAARGKTCAESGACPAMTTTLGSRTGGEVLVSGGKNFGYSCSNTWGTLGSWITANKCCCIGGSPASSSSASSFIFGSSVSSSSHSSSSTHFDYYCNGTMQSTPCSSSSSSSLAPSSSSRSNSSVAAGLPCSTVSAGRLLSYGTVTVYHYNRGLYRCDAGAVTSILIEPAWSVFTFPALSGGNMAYAKSSGIVLYNVATQQKIQVEPASSGSNYPAVGSNYVTYYKNGGIVAANIATCVSPTNCPKIQIEPSYSGSVYPSTDGNYVVYYKSGGIVAVNIATCVSPTNCPKIQVEPAYSGSHYPATNGSTVTYFKRYGIVAANIATCVSPTNCPKIQVEIANSRSNTPTIGSSHIAYFKNYGIVTVNIATCVSPTNCPKIQVDSPGCSDPRINNNTLTYMKTGVPRVYTFGGSSSSASSSSAPAVFQCNDHLDNDGDGLIDYAAVSGDPGCANAQDNDERNICPPQTPSSTCRCAADSDCTAPDTCFGDPKRCLYQADLTLTGEVVSPLPRGTNATYTYRATNAGPSAAPIVRLRHVPTMQFPLLPSSDPSCSVQNSASGAYVECALTGLAVNETRPVTLTFDTSVPQGQACAPALLQSTATAVPRTAGPSVSDIYDPTPASMNLSVDLTCPCGNGAIDPGEQCDDGNTSDADACNNQCQFTHCGDAIMQQPNGDGMLEQCDLGSQNTTTCQADYGQTCTYCSSLDCTTQTATGPRCHDGVIQADHEVCDDGPGHEGDGDGCSASCQQEAGWSCTGTPSICTPLCGNGTIDTGEACDDHNTASGDGCAFPVCTVEDGWACVPDPQCATQASGGFFGSLFRFFASLFSFETAEIPSCPSVCTRLCGNGVQDPGEQCDDGNQTNGDGCASAPGSLCTVETGWTCSNDPMPSVCVQDKCGNGQDDDGDGALDQGDPDCHTDHDVRNALTYQSTLHERGTTGVPECQDTSDNDGDGATDHPADLQCASALDRSETTAADLSVSYSALTGGIDAFYPGGKARYLATVRNFGPNAATSVIVRDPVPAGLTFIPPGQPGGSDAGCALDAAGTVVECAIASIDAPSSPTPSNPHPSAFVYRYVNFQIPATQACGANPDVTVTNGSMIVSSDDDRNTENDASTSAITKVHCVADLSLQSVKIQGQDPPSSVTRIPDGAATYTFTVRNDGPTDAPTAYFTHYYKIGTRLTPLTYQTGTSGDGGVTCSDHDWYASCTIAPFPSGAEKIITLTYDVDKSGSSSSSAPCTPPLNHHRELVSVFLPTLSPVVDTDNPMGEGNREFSVDFFCPGSSSSSTAP